MKILISDLDSLGQNIKRTFMAVQLDLKLKILNYKAGQIYSMLENLVVELDNLNMAPKLDF